MKPILFALVSTCCIGIIWSAPPPPPPPPIDGHLVRKTTESIIDFGLDSALENPLIPIEAKIAIGTTRA